MSYRSLFIRAFRTPRDRTYCASRWYSASSDSARTHATRVSSQTDDSNLVRGLQELEAASRESKNDVKSRSCDHERFSAGDETEKPARPSYQSQSPASIKQITSKSGYQKKGVQRQFLRETTTFGSSHCLLGSEIEQITDNTPTHKIRKPTPGLERSALLVSAPTTQMDYEHLHTLQLCPFR